MKKIALIQPETKKSNSLGIKKSPESIQALAGQLESEGYEVQMFHDYVDEAYKKVLEFDPEYIGISAMSSNFIEAKQIAKLIKEKKQDTPIILGGWHLSGAVRSFEQGVEDETITEIFNDSSHFDYGIVGEGEKALHELIRKLDSRTSIDNTSGLVRLDNGKILVNPAKRVMNLDELSDPSWNGLDINKYRDLRNNNLDLSVHFNRACRFDCSFCSTSSVYGRGVKQRSAEKAVKYLEKLMNKYNPQVITFTDEDFFANKEWVEELVGLIESKKLHERYNVSFDTFASVNDLDYFKKNYQGDFLKRMKKAGFSSFTIGIESLNPDVLMSYNKDKNMILPMMTREQREAYNHLDDSRKKEALLDFYNKKVQEAVNFAYDNNILIVGDYILGNIGEKREELINGFDKFSKLENLFVAYIPVFTPFPGTKLWNSAYNSGKLKRTAEDSIDWTQFDAGEGAMQQDYDIKGLRNQLELEFYTSDRYHRDMNSLLNKNPDMKGLFKSRFEYLQKMHGNLPILQKRLEEL